jgi:uroporphyrinogen decarboxylase
VDIQEVMPFGTVADVKEEVRLRIRQLGPGGGYLLGPAHDLQPEVPVENVLALFDAVREYGTYPLS